MPCESLFFCNFAKTNTNPLIKKHADESHHPHAQDCTLALTLIGSLIAQVNAVVLDRTVIIISHSISQIIDSDMIYALRDGRVEQFGNPDELYQKDGVYKDIVDASARSLNIDKLAHTLDRNGDGQLFD